jgi:hypothetical protein
MVTGNNGLPGAQGALGPSSVAFHEKNGSSALPSLLQEQRCRERPGLQLLLLHAGKPLQQLRPTHTNLSGSKGWADILGEAGVIMSHHPGSVSYSLLSA